MADEGDMEDRPVLGRTYARRARRRAEVDAAEFERLQALRARLSDASDEADDEGSSDSSIADDDDQVHAVGVDESPGNPGSDIGSVSDQGEQFNIDAESVIGEEGSVGSDVSGVSDGAEPDGAESDGAESDGPAADGVEDEDGDGQINFNNEAEREAFLISSLRKWALAPGVLSMSKVDEILKPLNRLFANVPLSHKTLLKSDNDYNINILPSGAEFWYNGIKKNLDTFDLRQYLQKFNRITLDINMDGLPLFKSSKMKFFPILGSLVGTHNEPFVIALHFGVGEPTCGEDFLPDFVREVNYLQQHGYEYENTLYPFEIRHYIMDAIARQLVKCIKSHVGFSSCEKCCVVGVTVESRRTFLDLNQPKRTDQSFQNQDDPAHHTGVSLLAATGVGFVSQFRLDPMHLLYQGVMKKILDNWLNIVGPWKLHHQIVDLISQLLVFIADTCPSDFNRKPRSLSEFGVFKATEFRRILLYDSMLVFKDLIDENIYNHFMLFQCAVYILSRPDLLETKLHDSREFLKVFIEHSAVIYGERFVIYNVHSLIHLPEECEIGGVVEDFSAFKFENALKSLKDSLRSGFKPLQQVAKKAEERAHEKKKIKFSDVYEDPVVSIKNQVANEIVAGNYFKKITFGTLSLQVDKRNSCFQTKIGDIVVLKNVVFRNGRVCLVGCRFLNREDYFTYPVASSELDIFRVWNLEERRRIYHCRELKFKCWLMPEGLKFLCVPLFVVCKFIPKDQSKPTYMEVGLSKWLVGPSKTFENMYEIRWPKKENTVPTFIKKKALPESDWTTETVVIKRWCVTWIKARDALKHLCDDSNYESEKEFGRGLRKKKRNPKFQFTDSGSDNEREMLKQTTMKIAPPPPVRKCNPNVASTKDSTTQKSAANARVNRQNDSNQERLKQINSKIADARKVVAEKMQKSVASGNSDKTSLSRTSSLTLPVVSSNADDRRPCRPNTTVTAVSISRNNSNNGKLSSPGTYHSLSPPILSRKASDRQISSNTTLSTGDSAMNNSNYDKTVRSHNSLNFDSLFAASSRVADASDLLNSKQNRLKVKESASKPSATVAVVDTPSNLPPLQDISSTLNISDNDENDCEDLGHNSSFSRNNRINLNDSATSDCSEYNEERDFCYEVTLPSDQDGVEFENEKERDSEISDTGEISDREADGVNTDGENAGDEGERGVGEDGVHREERRQSFESDSDIIGRPSIKDRLSALEKKQTQTFILSKEISAKLDQVLMNQGKLNRTLLPHEKKINKPANMPPLPLCSLDQFRTFESFLENNENFTAMVFYMSSYVCKDEEKSARKLLSRLLANELASMFTYHGATTGKRGFKDSHLGEVFEGTLLSSFKDSDLSAARDAAGKWFRNAPYRKTSTGETLKRQSRTSQTSSKRPKRSFCDD
ncbi:Valine--tRNA ligase [Frankliniella fusca]|uniref:Valine--tRNA ligase n=1 Tax=Frankliniella fusca TaxID=407009 RepID=A0AAE1HVS4_9NEOP|nr:Valine--tRNA ligase [Frankliniella fusca]